MGEGRDHPFLCHSPTICSLFTDRDLPEGVSVVFLPSRDGKFLLQLVQPSQSLYPQGLGLPRASSQSGLTSPAPTAYLIQGEGGRMGSLVLQGQHPHFQLNQVRKRAQSQIRRGSAASVWEAGETVGAAPLLPTRSPGQISRYMSAQTFPGLRKPSSLEIGRIQGQRNPPTSLQGR